MITELPKNWKDLQDKVNFIFSCVGLISEKEKQIQTPRGSVEIDVYAVDPLSVDKIIYIVECKNWSNKIPQTVIHSFVTVMQETGSNIGYIISKKGFQKGATEYVNSTNIRLFTFEAFQKHYLNSWYKNYFAPEIFKADKNLFQFTEPINSRRFRYQEHLNAQQKLEFERLLDKYTPFSNLVLILGSQGSKYINIFSANKYDIVSLEEIAIALNKCFQRKYSFENYIEALETIKTLIDNGVSEFVDVFGKNIFID